MKFEDFPYQRPDIEQFSKDFRTWLDAFAGAENAAEQSAALAQINELRVAFYTAFNICHIRHTMDINDPFYEAENNFFDQQMPEVEALVNEYYDALLQSRFRDALEQRWGKQLFAIAGLTRRTFLPEILPDLREENRLSSEYVKMKAGALIEFEGETCNLAVLQKLETDRDRNRRRAASEAKWNFFAGQAGHTEAIFDELVKTRHGIARKLGFDNFIELGYARLLRSDYGPGEVARFRDHIAEHVVPLATALFDRQRRRIGLDDLYYYDESFRFSSGNPEPQGDPAWIVDRAGRMYAELSPETNDFFTHLRTNHLMDLETRPGKATGGYCTYIGQYQAPFIFSNFTGTSADIDVLTHEAGHAFQVYCSRDIGITEYNWPTYEACEIHSMSMEFFTWPWMPLFFEAASDKYHFAHLAGAVCFLPYGVAIDEFQHFVYAHPEASPAERNQAWREIERRYLPHRRYDGNAFLEKGGFWHKQSHIFVAPFYYIDYALAQICAFQFWKRSQARDPRAWEDYLKLCRAGGSLSFLQLVKLAGLQSPFDEDTIRNTVTDIADWLNAVDDSKF